MTTNRLTASVASVLARLGLSAQVETPALDAAAIAAAAAAAATASKDPAEVSDDADKDEGMKDKKKDGGEGDDDETMPDMEAAITGAVAAANARWTAVLGNKSAEGKTATAVTLLGASTMTADAIIQTLATVPSSSDNTALAALMEQANPNLGAGGDSGDQTVQVDAIWDKAIANLPTHKRR